MKRSTVFAITAVLVVLCGLWYTQGIVRSKPDLARKDLSIGIVTWIGYGPLFVGKEKGLFKGLNLNIRVMDEPGVREAAYASGEIDLFPNSPDAFVILAASRPLNGRIVLAFDESRGADGIVARASMQGIASLRGKEIGFQKGITSHFMLLYALDQAGIAPHEVKQVDLSAGDAGAALFAGKLDAAVTWEPWLSRARKNSETRILKTSADFPGLLTDVLLVSNKLMNDRMSVCSFLNGWRESVVFLRGHPDEALAIIARAFKLEVTELKSMMEETHFFSAEESRAYLLSDNQKPSFQDTAHAASQLYQRAGVISRDVDISPLLDRSFITTGCS